VSGGRKGEMLSSDEGPFSLGDDDDGEMTRQRNGNQVSRLTLIWTWT
jgi:hypothetical protein